MPAHQANYFQVVSFKQYLIASFLVILTWYADSKSVVKMSLISKIKVLPSLLKGTVLEGQALKCIYSAKKDGFSSSSFHNKMDYNPPLPTLVLLQTKSGVLCGAYNPLGWQSRDDYRESIKTFLFRINNKGEADISRKLAGGPAVYDFGDRALWFAEGLYVPLNEKYAKVRKASSGLGTSFTALPGGEGSILGGGFAEIEEMECHVSSPMLDNSKSMYMKDDSKPSPMKSFERLIFGGDQ